MKSFKFGIIVFFTVIFTSLELYQEFSLMQIVLGALAIGFLIFVSYVLKQQKKTNNDGINDKTDHDWLR